MSVIKTDKTKDLLRLDVSVSKDLIAKNFKNKLNKTAQGAKIKGFRPGKAPLTLIKKMQGQDILVDVVFGELNKEMESYLDAEGIKTFGQPVSDDANPKYTFDPDDIQDFNASFLIVKEPDVELDDLNFGSELAYYLPILSQEEKQKRVENLRYDVGGFAESDGPSVAKSILEFHGVELEGNDLIEEGREIRFRQPLESIQDETLRESLTGVSKGHSFDFNINQFSDSDHVKANQILQLEEGEVLEEKDYIFRATVEKIEIPVLADLDEDFFEKISPDGEVKAIEDLEKIFEDQFSSNFRNNSDIIFFYDFRKFVESKFELDLDKSYYEKYFTQVINLNQHAIDFHLDQYIDDYKWAWIKNYIDLELGLEVTRNDVVKAIKNEIISYLRGNVGSSDMLNQYAEKMMSDEKIVQRKSDELYMSFLAQKLVEAYEVKETFVPFEEYQAKVERLNNEISEMQNALQNHDHGHDHDLHDHNHDDHADEIDAETVTFQEVKDDEEVAGHNDVPTTDIDDKA